MTARILVIEDDPALLTILEAAIAYGGFTSHAVRSGREGADLFGGGGFDAVLLDLGLPDFDGGELLKTLRQMSDVPIIVVSGRGTERDKIEALDLGADDYVAKPFLPGELLARIRAALRRYSTVSRDGGADDERNPVTIGALTIDPFHQTAAIDGRQASLNDAEYKVLKTLAAKQGEVVPRSELLGALYGDELPSETKIVEVYISHIRKKLRELSPEDLITNQRGRGWVLRVPTAK